MGSGQLVIRGLQRFTIRGLEKSELCSLERCSQRCWHLTLLALPVSAGLPLSAPSFAIFCATAITIAIFLTRVKNSSFWAPGPESLAFFPCGGKR